VTPESARVNSSRTALLAVAAVTLTLRMAPTGAQSLPPLPPEKLSLAADHIESFIILGGDYGASGGAYAFRGTSPVNLSVDKAGGAGDVGDPRPLGDSGVKWNPYFAGNIGYVSSSDIKVPAPLAGNTVDVNVIGGELGGGVRFWFTDRFSMATGVSGIYARTEQTFNALTEPGKSYLPAMQQAGWVDWKLDTWTAVPSLDAKYLWGIGRTNIYWQSVFGYYHTESFNNSSIVDINGNSQTWKNTLDVDVPLGWTLFGREVHTGGHLDQLQLFGNFRDGLDTNHLYTVNARLVLDMLSSLKMVYWMGLGASYTWSGNISGWSVGISMRLKL
jgi:hypothetical protein